jgi:hypothetical protein
VLDLELPFLDRWLRICYLELLVIGNHRIGIKENENNLSFVKFAIRRVQLLDATDLVNLVHRISISLASCWTTVEDMSTLNCHLSWLVNNISNLSWKVEARSICPFKSQESWNSSSIAIFSWLLGSLKIIDSINQYFRCAVFILYKSLLDLLLRCMLLNFLASFPEILLGRVGIELQLINQSINYRFLPSLSRIYELEFRLTILCNNRHINWIEFY